MSQALNIQLSTTFTIVGHQLVRHVGPISAQFVIGTGLLTDVFSSFTDFFGAGSRSYEKKLAKVERQGLAMIRARAAQVGANAVIGLRIDHDEISGGGKSMLMVTLSGTGVVARKAPTDETGEVDGTLSPHLLQRDVDVRAFIAEHSGNTDGFPDAQWDFVLEHPQIELAPLVLRRAAAGLDAQVAKDYFEALGPATAFFASLPINEARPFLYDRFHLRAPYGRAAAEMLSRAQLADPDRHLEALKSGEVWPASNALRSVTAHAPLYRPEDIETLRAMATQLREGFPITATIHEKEGVLSRATWTCGNCGTENPSSKERCVECRCDQRGLDGVSADFDALAAELETRASVLEARLGE